MWQVRVDVHREGDPVRRLVRDLPGHYAGACSLARVSQALGDAGVNLEGGGMWSGIAHYLVEDADAALGALTAAGIGPVLARPALIVDLDADVPGALGKMMRGLSDKDIRLHAQYSDHGNRKVLLVEDLDTAQAALRTKDQR